MRAGVGVAACLAAAALISGREAHAQAAAVQSQGKVVAIAGRVDHTIASAERWTPAHVLQPLLVAERVRTLEASRASILFVDETQVKLNAGSILTITQVRTSGGSATSMDLQRGEAWFRTKNPRSGLTVRTAAASAAIRGTEINVSVSAAGATTLTVVEGAAELFNPQGTVLVNAGEEGVAVAGGVPTKRVILNPEDAVQWALYYPLQVAYHDLPAPGPGADQAAVAQGFALRRGDGAGALRLFDAAPQDPWGRLGASLAYLSGGDIDRARTVIAAPFTDTNAEIERRAQLAAVALAAGDVVSARREIEAARAPAPTALRPLLLMSSLELRRNRADTAGQIAERALAAHPHSVGALIAMSEAAQASSSWAALAATSIARWPSIRTTCAPS